MALTAAGKSVQYSEKSSGSTTESGPSTSAASWDLRHPGCIMRGANAIEAIAAKVNKAK